MDSTALQVGCYTCLTYYKFCSDQIVIQKICKKHYLRSINVDSCLFNPEREYTLKSDQGRLVDDSLHR